MDRISDGAMLSVSSSPLSYVENNFITTGDTVRIWSRYKFMGELELSGIYLGEVVLKLFDFKYSWAEGSAVRVLFQGVDFSCKLIESDTKISHIKFSSKWVDIDINLFRVRKGKYYYMGSFSRMNNPFHRVFDKKKYTLSCAGNPDDYGTWPPLHVKLKRSTPSVFIT